MCDALSDKPTPIEHRLAQFLSRACVELGFCLPPKVKGNLVANPGETASFFVSQVMIAEGLNPQSEKRHFRALHQMLLGMVGSERLLDVGLDIPDVLK